MENVPFFPPPLFFSPLWLQQRFWDRHGGKISFFADMAETFMPKCIALDRKLEKKKRNVAYARATDHFLWKMRLETRNDAKKPSLLSDVYHNAKIVFCTSLLYSMPRLRFLQKARSIKM